MGLRKRKEWRYGNMYEGGERNRIHTRWIVNLLTSCLMNSTL